MAARYAYSLSGENYTGSFATREEALAAALDDARDPQNQFIGAQTVFVARRVEADPHATGHAKTVLREMAWQAHDEVGAPAANYLNQLHDEQIQELDRAIEGVLYQWLRKNDLVPTYFRVEGISEHPIPPAPSMNGKNVDTDEVNQVGESRYPSAES